MFKEVRLTRGAWHWKLQKYVFGSIPFSENFCPYFWLTGFCMLIFLPLLFSRVFYLSLKLSFKYGCKAVTWADDTVNRLLQVFFSILCDPVYQYSVRNMDEAQLADCWYKSRYRLNDLYKRKDTDVEALDEYHQHPIRFSNTSSSSRRLGKLNKRFETWRKQKGDTWEAEVKEAMRIRKEKQATRVAMLKAQAEYAAQRQKKFSERKQVVHEWGKDHLLWIIKLTKIIFPVFMLTALFAILFGLWKFAVWVYGFEFWPSWWANIAAFFSTAGEWLVTYGPKILFAIVFIAIVVVIVTLIFKGFTSLVSKCDITLPQCKFIKKFFGFCWKFIKILFLPFHRGTGALFGGVIGFFAFFWIYPTAAAKDQCPGIVWGDRK